MFKVPTQGTALYVIFPAPLHPTLELNINRYIKDSFFPAQFSHLQITLGLQIVRRLRFCESFSLTVNTLEWTSHSRL